MQLAGELASFQAIDLLTIGTLAILEGILSVDNALVLAILVRDLPPRERKKALTYGIIGAFVFRIIALIFAAHLMRWMIFKVLGGGYLIYLAMKQMFFSHREDAEQSSERVSRNFWMTVIVVELTDIAFSIDSITAAIAMSNKLLIVWIGGILGIICLRFAANLFVSLLERLPKLEDLAYQLILFIGIKLFLDAFGIHLDHAVFWAMMAIISTIGASLVYRDYRQRNTHTQFCDRLLRQVQEGEMTIDELCRLQEIPGPVFAWLCEQGEAPCAVRGTSDKTVPRP
jgi:YkoY family integral membrane protein